MIAKKVWRYYAECGRGFWSKQKAITHDTNCKCWKNPKFKTCLSCKFKDIGTDSNGMEEDSRQLQTWSINNCKHSNEGSPVHVDHDHIRRYCPSHQTK